MTQLTPIMQIQQVLSFCRNFKVGFWLLNSTYPAGVVYAVLKMYTEIQWSLRNPILRAVDEVK